jgi:hypothetical protein
MIVSVVEIKIYFERRHDQSWAILTSIKYPKPKLIDHDYTAPLPDIVLALLAAYSFPAMDMVLASILALFIFLQCLSFLMTERVMHKPLLRGCSSVNDLIPISCVG